MSGVEINWLRWFVFALVGLPLLVWLVATRNNAMRAIAIVAVVIFIQDLFVFRRYVLSFGVGPSLILCYTTVMGLYFRDGRLPRLGLSGPLWLLFLTSAMIAVVVGSVGTGLVFLNLSLFQEYYLEGLLFFVFGMMALKSDDEVLRFFFWFSVVVVLGVTLLHVFELVSGWRPANIARGVAEGKVGEGKIETPGGVFPNPNTLGSFYVMTIPVVLAQTLRGGWTGWRRALLAGALVLMSMSLLLTTARSAMIFTPILCAVALVLCGFSVVRVLAALLGGAVLLGAAWGVADLLLPDFLGRVTGQLQEEGLETNRFQTWWTFTQMALDHPLGLGLDLTTVKAIRLQYHTRLGSAHNVYIDRAVQAGVLGLIAFLALIGHIVLRNLRALRLNPLRRSDPVRRRALTYLLLPLLGFLASGLAEPIYDNGSRITILFWFLSGLSYAASARAPDPEPVRTLSASRWTSAPAAPR